MDNVKRSRLRLLIYPRFQLTLIATNLLSIALAFSFIIVELHRSFGSLRSLGSASGLEPGHPYFKFLLFQEQTMANYILMAVVAGFLVSGLLALVVSHRMAGPLVRLTNYFKAMSENNAPTGELKFRKGDYPGKLPEYVNRALEIARKK